MPKKLHDKLARQAKKKGVRDKDAYVYGTMNKIEKAKKKKGGKGGKKRK